MMPVDSMLLGAVGSLSGILGISRIGCTVGFATMRGVERKSALQWALLLSIHALCACVILDLINLFAGAGTSSWLLIFNYILAGIASYFCARVSINLVRFLTVKANHSVFAYYCWGASLFAFILYLTVI